VTAPSPARRALVRESLYLLAGVLAGLTLIPAIGSTYYREDIAIGFRQFFGGLFDADTWFIAVPYVLAPYLLLQLVRSAVWAWRRLQS